MGQPPQHPRFSRVKRNYTAEEVVNKRGTLPLSYPSNTMAQKMWSLLESKSKGEGGGCSMTYGAYVLPSCLVLHLSTSIRTGLILPLPVFPPNPSRTPPEKQTA